MMHTLLPILMLLTPQEPDLGQQVAAAKLTMVQAVDIAARTAGSGVVVQAELEFEKGTTVWSMDVAQGHKVVEVLVDAKTGKVLERSEEDEDQSAVVAAAPITLKSAIAAVVAQQKGTPVMAQLKLVEGKPTAMVDLFAAGKTESFRVDAVGDDGPGNGQRRSGGEEAGEDEEDEEAGEKGEGAGEDAATRGVVFTQDFGEEAADLVTTGRNPYFVLEPGYTLVLEGKEDDADKQIVITVLEETKVIGGIEARVVEERETSGGQLEELTRDYFAISKRTNNVYYLGEDVDVYEDGKVKGHEGSWLHGKDGARFGLMMPGTPLLGARFQQEVAPGVGMDRAEIASLSGRFECKGGRFEHVLTVIESSPLEKGRERKIYARGVGLLQDGGLKLVRYGMAHAK